MGRAESLGGALLYPMESSWLSTALGGRTWGTGATKDARLLAEGRVPFCTPAPSSLSRVPRPPSPIRRRVALRDAGPMWAVDRLPGPASLRMVTALDMSL